MQPIKIDKHTAKLVDDIRRLVNSANVMPGIRNAILSKCDKLNVTARKAAAQLQRGHYRTAAYDARTNDDIAAQMRAKKAVFAAMLEGAHVDLTMADRFQLSQMHTAIHQIRQDIRRKNLPVQLCDEWFRPGDGQRPYKKYWLIQKEEEKPCS